MFETPMRGGLTCVGSNRPSKANHKEMGEMYDPKRESSYITYVDANDLYGYALSEALPYEDIKFDNDTHNQVLMI